MSMHDEHLRRRHGQCGHVRGAAARPIAAIARFCEVSPGQNVSLNASGSAAACGRTIAAFAWAVTDPVANPPAITGANTAGATVVAPTAGSVTFRVTVTDDLGRIDSAEVVIEPTHYDQRPGQRRQRLPARPP